MATTREMSHTEYFAALKAAGNPSAMHELVLGSAPPDKETLAAVHEALLLEGEEAGDNKDYGPAAEAFRKDSVSSWAQDDNRMVENISTQALYYGTLTSLDTLLENYATVWAMWAHMLPKLKPRDRARLQDFARFRRSFELGVRERDRDDAHVSAAVALLAQTFDKVGALNLRAVNEKKTDLTEDAAGLWDEVSQLIQQIETLVAR